MPNPNYSKTIVYKIVCNDLSVTDVYVGHTTNFRHRKTCHKANCNNENDKHYHLKVYETIRQNCGWNNWSMIEIEKYPCNDANEAKARERYWYEELKANLNEIYPGRNRKEYIETHKQEKQLTDKTYYETHKEEITEKNKIYYNEHFNQIKEYKKKWSEENKEKINARRRELRFLKKQAEANV